ncbi:MAG: hypothetical protein VB058_05780 [Oscillospiraceae bacterium]|nr:hypothetical protein [Oscillospiraceae bacterium]
MGELGIIKKGGGAINIATTSYSGTKYIGNGGGTWDTGLPVKDGVFLLTIAGQDSNYNTINFLYVLAKVNSGSLSLLPPSSISSPMSIETAGGTYVLKNSSVSAVFTIKDPKVYSIY